MNARLAALRDKLLHLKARDTRFEVFGSGEKWGGHRYALKPVLVPEERAAFEARFGVRLPEEYAAFLSEVANGGAGPSYGLFSLSDALADRWGEDPPSNALSQPFPFTREDARRILAHRQSEPGYREPMPARLHGCLELAEHGCGWSSVLVVTGDGAGDIWYVGDGACPEVVDDETSALHTFTSWYERWLDAGLAPGRLTSDPDAPIEAPLEVKGLSFERRGLTSIPAPVFACANLEKLNLNNNALGDLPEQLGELTALREVHACWSKVTRLPESLGRLRRLRVLSLQSNALTRLPDSLTELGELEWLTVCHNRLQGLPDDLGRLTRLKHLNIEGNQIPALPESLGQLQLLSDLDLSWNRLSTLPETLVRLPLLTTLSLRANAFRSLPEVVARLPVLRELSLYELPELDLAEALRKLSRAPKLEKLDLQTGALPEEVGLLKGLRRLRVDAVNRWSEDARPLTLPPELGSLPLLEELSLEGNRLEEVPAWLCELPRLEVLYLGENRLTRIPDAMARLPRLRQLMLRGNPLSEAERARLERLLPNVELSLDEASSDEDEA